MSDCEENLVVKTHVLTHFARQKRQLDFRTYFIKLDFKIRILQFVRK